MNACTFFGHSDCPDNLETALVHILAELITKHDVKMFYVGNQGRFDKIVLRVLRIMNTIDLIEFNYAVVLAYMPDKQQGFVRYVQGETMLPEGIETVHPKFAISWRNMWMLNHADYVVSYTKHSWGGAAKYTEKVRRMGKKVINIVD